MIPQNIKDHKPETAKFGATEIRLLQGHYYVYEITSKWDSQKGRPKKVTGKSIGKITENDGFIPNAYCMKKYALANPIVRTYGVFEMFQQLGQGITNKLKEIFPDLYREIMTVAQLRLVYGCTPKLMPNCFEDSYLSDLYPDIGTSDKTVRELTRILGSYREADILRFMRLFVSDQATIMIDGTSIFAQNEDSYTKNGYNPEHKKKTQIRLLYIFDSSSYEPVFYSMLPGNISDKAAMVNSIELSGVKDCLIIGDKTFYSKQAISFLLEKKLQYILPLQHNTKLITNEFENTPDEKRWDGYFLYKNRIIHYHKEPSGNLGNFLYIFRDESKKLTEEQKIAKENTEKDPEEATDLYENPRRGMFSYVSNLDQSAEHIYLKYKERWDIEQCFDYLKNSVDIGSPYQRNNESLRGWTFINHVSLLYFYTLVRALRKSGLNNKYDPNDVIMLAKNIYKIKMTNVFNLNQILYSEVSNKDKEVFKSLGVDLFRN